MKKLFHAPHFAVLAIAALVSSCATTTNDSISGGNRKQLLLFPESTVKMQAEQFYNQQNMEASRKRVLMTAGVERERLVTIMNRMTPHAKLLREDAADWKWELALIDEPTVNAHVMAGGKITFYTGLIRKLHATDDELAAVMGHEIAHALREHTREKMSQQFATDMAVQIGVAAAGGDRATGELAKLAKTLALDLPFSRSMESEADAFGLELSARAGYDPQATVTLWEKMGGLAGSSGPSFMSTHPASLDRQEALRRLIPSVQPLYATAHQAYLQSTPIVGTTLQKKQTASVLTAQETASGHPAVSKAEQALTCKTLQYMGGIESDLRNGGFTRLVSSANGTRDYVTTNLSLFGMKTKSMAFFGDWESDAVVGIDAVFEADIAQAKAKIKKVKGDKPYSFAIQKSGKGSRVVCYLDR